MLGTFRAVRILTLFLLLTLPLMPVQALLLAFGARSAARQLPRLYHRAVIALLGVRVHLSGPLPAPGTLIAANHISWLDIPVISSVAPVSFVAKREVSAWPFVGWLARLQRTVFIDRKRRADTATRAGEIAARLAEGDIIVLFAEGTSGDGNCVLRFKSSLFAAAEGSAGAHVQSLAIAYTHLHGLPLSRQQRVGIAWYGDMDMASHAMGLLRRGPIDVHIVLSPPAVLEAGRKAIAAEAEAQVRAAFARALTGRG